MLKGDGQPVPLADPHRRLLAFAELARPGAPDIDLGRRPDTIRPGLTKVAGRVTKMVTRIKVALPTTYPYQIGFTALARRLAKPPP